MKAMKFQMIMLLPTLGQTEAPRSFKTLVFHQHAALHWPIHFTTITPNGTQDLRFTH